MPVYVVCRRCSAKIYLAAKRRSWLPPAFRAKCPVCGYEDVYSQRDADEEDVYTFTCPVCRRRFYITRRPPVTVVCPHCSSTLSIPSAQGEPLVVKMGEGLPSAVATAAFLGTLIGALMGAAASKDKVKGAIEGGLGGGLVGALIGTFIDLASEPEAKYVE